MPAFKLAFNVKIVSSLYDLSAFSCFPCLLVAALKLALYV
jgi:hypothetical protein